MARDLMNETYYTPKTKGNKIPIKWTAPEVGGVVGGVVGGAVGVPINVSDSPKLQ